ncbi:MAG: HTH domain-containing protein [Cyclobacteriaceae bacterium]|nr:HTH domain-containing protein [Cyclobacteriaceae bacterium]
MLISKYINRIERLDQMIRLKATGSADDLAEKLGITSRMIHYYLDYMKDIGAPIRFCHTNRCYYYEYPVSFSFGFDKSKL